MDDLNDTKNRRSHVTSLPSDYSDVQPRNYDPEFISNISNQMQVPDSIPVLNGDDTELAILRNEDWRGTTGENGVNPHSMNVPERIMLAGGGHHIGAKPEIPSLNFDNLPRGGSPEIVGLQTPPRTLTLDEQFPSLDQQDEEVEDNNSNARIPNGSELWLKAIYYAKYIFDRTLTVRQPFTVAGNDNFSLTEEESAQLRVQLTKLNKRLNNLERQQEVQGNRERAMVGAAISYFVFKFVFWFFRSK